MEDKSLEEEPQTPSTETAEPLDEATLRQMLGPIARQLAGKPLADALAPGSHSPLAALIGLVVEESLKQEMTDHLGYEPYQRTGEPKDNARNGFSTKTLKTSHGPVDIKVPRDRNASFEPHVVPVGQTVSQELEQRVFALLHEGMSTHQIEEHLRGIYHARISASSISALAQKLDAELKQWRNRPLERVYPVLIVDAIYLKIRHARGVESTAVYQVCAWDDHGRLEILGVWIAEDGSSGESSTFWHKIFLDLKRRGLEDVVYLCMDGLSGLPQAARATWPRVNVQPCVVHLVRNSLRHVSSKKRHVLTNGLRAIYQAPTYEAAELALARLAEQWGEEHVVVRQWEENLPALSELWNVGEALRKKISTTNAIENLHSQQRRYLKAVRSFPSRESALRRVTGISRKLSDKYTSVTQIRAQWKSVVNELHMLFPERMPPNWGYPNGM